MDDRVHEGDDVTLRQPSRSTPALGHHGSPPTPTARPIACPVPIWWPAAHRGVQPLVFVKRNIALREPSPSRPPDAVDHTCQERVHADRHQSHRPIPTQRPIREHAATSPSTDSPCCSGAVDRQACGTHRPVPSADSARRNAFGPLTALVVGGHAGRGLVWTTRIEQLVR
jgi:hypothetical protein